MPGKYPRPVVCYFFIIKYCLAFAKLQKFSVMTRFSGENRRPSTVMRDNSVHEAYRQLQQETGEYFRFLPREFVYDQIRQRTGLCTKTIAFILNHTKWQEVK